MADAIREYVIKIRAEVKDALAQIDQLKGKFDKIELKTEIDKSFQSSIEKLSGSIGKITQEMGDLKSSFNEVDFKSFTGDMKSSFDELKASIDDIKASAKTLADAFDFSGKSNNGFQNFINDLNNQISDLAQKYQESVQKINEMASQGFVPKGSPASGQSGFAATIAKEGQQVVNAADKVIHDVDEKTKELADATERFNNAVKSYKENKSSINNVISHGPQDGRELESLQEALAITQELLEATKELEKHSSKKGLINDTFSKKESGIGINKAELKNGIADLKNFRKQLSDSNFSEKDQQVVKTKVRFVVDYDVLNSDDSKEQAEQIKNIVDNIREKVTEKVQKEMMNHPIRIPISFGSYEEMKKEYEKAERQTDKAVKELTDEKHEKSLIRELELKVTAKTDGLIDDINTKIKEINEQIQTTIDVQINPVVPEKKDIGLAITRTENAIKDKIADLGSDEGIPIDFSGVIKGNVGTLNVADNRTHELLSAIQGVTEAILSRMGNFPPNGGGGGSYSMIRNTPPTPPTTPPSGGTQQSIPQTPIRDQLPQTSSAKLTQPNISQTPTIRTNKDVNVDGGKVIVQSPTETQNKNQPVQNSQQNIPQPQIEKAIKGLSLNTMLQTGLMGSSSSRSSRTPNQIINSARRSTLGTSALKGLFAGYIDANKLNAAKIFGQEKLVEGSKSLLSYIKNPSYGEKKYKENYYNASYKNGSGSGEYAYYGLSGQTLDEYQEMADKAFKKGRAAIEQHIQEINEQFEDALVSKELVIPDLLGRADGESAKGKNAISQYGTDIKVPKWVAMLLENDSRQMKNELTGKTFENAMNQKRNEDPGFFDRKRKELPKTVNEELNGLYSEREKLEYLLDREVFGYEREYKALESISNLINDSETYGDFKQGYKKLDVIAKDIFEENEELQDLLNTNSELYPVLRESLITSIDEKKNISYDKFTKREKQYSTEKDRYEHINNDRIPTLETRKERLGSGSDQQVLEEAIKQTHEEYRKNLLHYTGAINKEYEEQLRKLQKKQIDSVKEKDAKEAITSLFGANAFKEPKDQSVSIIDIKNPAGQRDARILESLGLKVDPKSGNLISFTGQDYDKEGKIVDGYLGSPLLTSSKWAYEDLKDRVLLLGKFGQKMLDHQMEITSALTKNEDIYKEYANRYKKISNGDFTEEDVAFIANHYNDIASLLKTETNGIGSVDFQTLDVAGNPDAKKVKESVLRVLDEKENGMFDENDVYNAVSAQLQQIRDSRAKESEIYRNYHMYQQEMVKKETTNYMSPETYQKYLKRAAELDKEKIYYRKKMRVTNNGFDRLSLTPYELDRYNQVDSESKELRNKIYAYEVGTGKRDIHGGLIDKSAFDVSKMSDKWMEKATVKIGSFNLTATDPELAKDYLKIAQGSAGSASGEVVDKLISTLSGHIESMPKTDVEKREIALGMLQKDIDGLEIELQKVDAELQEAQDFNEKNKVSIDQGLIKPKDIGNEKRGLLGKKKKLEDSIASLKDDSGKSATMQLLKSQIDEIQAEIDARNEWNEKNREDINRRFLREKSTYELETRRGHLQKQYDAVAADGGTQASAEIIANEQRLVDLRKEESDLITKVSDKTGVGEVLKGMIEDVRLAKEKERIANENVANFAYEDAHRRPNEAYTISVDLKTGDLIKTPIEPSTEENVANQIIRAVFGDDALPGFKFSGVPGYDSLGFKNEEDVGKYYASLLDYALDAKEEREYAQEKLAEIWNNDYTNEILQDLGVRGNNELGQLMDQLLENRQEQEKIRGELDILRGVTSDKNRKSIDPTRNGDYRNQRIQTYIDQINQQQTDVESALSHLLYLRGDTSLVQSAEKSVRERESFEEIAKHRKETLMKEDEREKSSEVMSKTAYARDQLRVSTEQQYANIEAERDRKINEINVHLDNINAQLNDYEEQISNRRLEARENAKLQMDRLTAAEEKYASLSDEATLSATSYLEDYQRFISGYSNPEEGLRELSSMALNSLWDVQNAIEDNIPKDKIAEMAQDLFNYTNMLSAGGYKLDYFTNPEDDLSGVSSYIRKEFPEMMFYPDLVSADKDVNIAKENFLAAKNELDKAEQAYRLMDENITSDIISLLKSSKTVEDFKQGVSLSSRRTQETIHMSRPLQSLLGLSDEAFKNNKDAVTKYAESAQDETPRVGDDQLAIQYSEARKAAIEQIKEYRQVQNSYTEQKDYIKRIAESDRQQIEEIDDKLRNIIYEEEQGALNSAIRSYYENLPITQYSKYLANRIGVVREQFSSDKVQDNSSGETRTKYTTKKIKLKGSDLSRRIGSGKSSEQIREEKKQRKQEIEEKAKEESARVSSQNRLDIARHEQSPEYKKVDKKMQELKETRIAESNKSREDSFFGWRYANMTDDQAEVTHIIDSLTKTQNKLGELNTKQEWLLSTSVQRAKELGLTLNENGLVNPLVSKEDYELNPSNYTLPHMSIEELQRRKLIRSKKNGSPYVKPKELDEEYFQYQSEEELLDRWYSNYVELESNISDQIDEQEKILADMHEAEINRQPQSQQKKSQVDRSAVSLIAAKSVEDYEDRILLGIEQGLHLGIKKGEAPIWYPQNKLDQMQQNGFMDATDQIKANGALAAQIAQEYYKSADASSSVAQATEGETKADQALTNASNDATAALNSQAEATGKVVDLATKQKELEQKKQTQQQPSQPKLKKETRAAAPEQPKVNAPVITKDGVDFNGKHYSLLPDNQQINVRQAKGLQGVYSLANKMGKKSYASKNVAKYLDAFGKTGSIDILQGLENTMKGGQTSSGLKIDLKGEVKKFILKQLLAGLDAGNFKDQLNNEYTKLVNQMMQKGSKIQPFDANRQIREHLAKLMGVSVDQLGSTIQSRQIEVKPTTLPPQPKIEPKDVAPVEQMADAQKEATKATDEQIQKTQQLKALLKDLNAGEFREQVGNKYKSVLGELIKEGSILTPEDAANQVRAYLGELRPNSKSSKGSTSAFLEENGVKQIPGLTSEQQTEYENWVSEILARGADDVSVSTMTWEDVQHELDELEAKYIAIGQASIGATDKATTGIDQIEQEAKEATPAVIDLKNALESMQSILLSSGDSGLEAALNKLSVKNIRDIFKQNKDNGFDVRNLSKTVKAELINRAVRDTVGTLPQVATDNPEKNNMVERLKQSVGFDLLNRDNNYLYKELEAGVFKEESVDNIKEKLLDVQTPIIRYLQTGLVDFLDQVDVILNSESFVDFPQKYKQLISTWTSAEKDFRANNPNIDLYSENNQTKIERLNSQLKQQKEILSEINQQIAADSNRNPNEYATVVDTKLEGRRYGTPVDETYGQRLQYYQNQQKVTEKFIASLESQISETQQALVIEGQATGTADTSGTQQQIDKMHELSAAASEARSEAASVGSATGNQSSSSSSGSSGNKVLDMVEYLRKNGKSLHNRWMNDSERKAPYLDLSGWNKTELAALTQYTLSSDFENDFPAPMSGGMGGMINHAIDNSGIITSAELLSQQNENALDARNSLIQQYQDFYIKLQDILSRWRAANEKRDDLHSDFDFDKDFGPITDDITKLLGLNPEKLKETFGNKNPIINTVRYFKDLLTTGSYTDLSGFDKNGDIPRLPGGSIYQPNNAINALIDRIGLSGTKTWQRMAELSANKSPISSGTTPPQILDSKPVKTEVQEIIAQCDAVIAKCDELKAAGGERTGAIRSGIRRISEVLSQDGFNSEDISDENLLKLSNAFNTLQNAAQNEASEMASGVKEYISQLLSKFNIEIKDLSGAEFNSLFMTDRFVGEGRTNGNQGIISKTSQPYVFKNNKLLHKPDIILDDGGISEDFIDNVFNEYSHAIETLKNNGLNSEQIAQVLFGDVKTSEVAAILSSKLPMDEIISQIIDTVGFKDRDGAILLRGQVFPKNYDFEKDRKEFLSNQTPVSTPTALPLKEESEAQQETGDVAQQAAGQVEAAEGEKQNAIEQTNEKLREQQQLEEQVAKYPNRPEKYRNLDLTAISAKELNKHLGTAKREYGKYRTAEVHESWGSFKGELEKEKERRASTVTPQVQDSKTKQLSAQSAQPVIEAEKQKQAAIEETTAKMQEQKQASEQLAKTQNDHNQPQAKPNALIDYYKKYHSDWDAQKMQEEALKMTTGMVDSFKAGGRPGFKFTGSEQQLEYIQAINTELEKMGYQLTKVQSGDQSYVKISELSTATEQATQAMNNEAAAADSAKQSLEGKATAEQQAAEGAKQNAQASQQAADTTKQEATTPKTSQANKPSKVADIIADYRKNTQAQLPDISVVQGEAGAFDSLNTMLSSTIPDAINTKNEAFIQEAQLVSQLAATEAQAFEPLIEKLQQIANLATNFKFDFKIQGGDQFNTEFLNNFESLKEKIQGIDPKQFESIGTAFSGIGNAISGKKDLSKYFSDLSTAIDQFSQSMGKIQINDNFTNISNLIDKISFAGDALKNALALVKNQEKMSSNYKYGLDKDTHQQVKDLVKEADYLSNPDRVAKAARLAVQQNAYEQGDKTQALKAEDVVFLDDYNRRAAELNSNSEALKSSLNITAEGFDAVVKAMNNYLLNARSAADGLKEEAEKMIDYSGKLESERLKLNAIPEEERTKFASAFGTLQNQFQMEADALQKNDISWKEYTANMKKHWEQYNRFKQIAPEGKLLMSNVTGSADDARKQISSFLKQNYKLVTEDVSGGAINSKGIAHFNAQVVDAENNVRNLKINWDSFNGAVGYTADTAAGQFKGRFMSLISDLQAKSKQLFVYWTATFLNPYRLIGVGKQVINIVKELDSAMMELRKVSSESAESYQDFQKESFDMADKVGGTAKDIITATTNWKKLGKSFEEAQEAGQASVKLLNVSEFQNIDDATTALVSMKQAFQDLTYDDFIDKVNAVGDSYSSSTDQLSQGMRDISAVMKVQGNDIDQTLALLTAANDVTQDISKSAMGIRTVALRMAGKFCPNTQ